MLKDYTYQFPNPTLPDKEKDEDYHKQYVLAITNRSLNYNFDLSYSVMNECYKYFDGTQSGEEFRFIQEAEDGSVLPAKWDNYNAVRQRVDLMVGELSQRGFEINVEAINKDAVSKKLEEREKARVDMRLAPLALELEESHGLPLNNQREESPTEQELDEFFDLKYKEKSELVMQGMMNYVAKKGNWEYTRLALNRDMWITGRCFVKTEIIDGVPTARRVDPRLMIFDPNIEDDLLTDSTYWGEVRYMDMAEAAEMYGLTEKEIKDAYNGYKEYEKLNSTSANREFEFSSLHGTNLKWFKEDRGNTLRILVLTAYWRDTINKRHKLSVDSYGNEHVKKLSDTYSPSTSDKIEVNRIPIWRTGTLIGGKIFKQWGQAENQGVKVDGFQVDTCPYYGVIPNYVNYQGISKVQQIKGLQDFKNISMYNIQLTMSRAGAKGFVYDVAQVPEGWDPHTMIKYLKTVGIAFIDSTKNGIPSQFNQFQPIDQTISSSVEQYLKIALMVDEQIDAITGINAERRGESKKYQPVGVTQSSLFQSNLMTEIYYKEFNMMSNNIFNALGSLGKICWANKEKFASIIGDIGINFLKDDIDLDLNDYGVFIEEVSPAIGDTRNFHALVMAALQSGNIDFVSAMKLLRERDMDYAIRQLERDIEKMRELQQEQAQMAEEAKLKQLEAQGKNIQAQKQMEQQNKLSEIDRKGQWDLKEKAVDYRSDLAKEKIDFAKALTIEGVKSRNAKRDEKANK